MVWSNDNAPEEVYIRAALLRPKYHLLLEIALELGLERLLAEWNFLEETDERTERVRAAVERMLGNIQEGFRRAAA